MTVHASKGLEFPVVFVVNLARGTGNRRNPVRWSPDGHEQAASVAVGDFQPETDERLTAREREETKRLLYVALTRARDRLYLSATVANGSCRTTRGSLGEVMPRSLISLFGEAHGTSGAAVTWTGANGRTHTFRVSSLRAQV